MSAVGKFIPANISMVLKVKQLPLEIHITFLVVICRQKFPLYISFTLNCYFCFSFFVELDSVCVYRESFLPG